MDDYHAGLRDALGGRPGSAIEKHRWRPVGKALILALDDPTGGKWLPVGIRAVAGGKAASTVLNTN